MTRRDFLKLMAMAPGLIALLDRQLIRIGGLQGAAEEEAARPNILILVYDALSAEHLPAYGYRRETTPNLSRFADQSTVYHSHFAGGNFTTPGTASLLTGAYPWTHRAFNIAASMDLSFRDKNLFSAFNGSGYHRLAYTHNWLANFFLRQFERNIDLLVKPETFFLNGTPGLERVFTGDRVIAQRSSFFLSRVIPTERVMPGSLFLSLLNEMRLEQFEASYDSKLNSLFPEGLPEEGFSKSFYLLEDAIDGIMDLVNRSPRPFLGYFHLYPPHYPYNPRREFIGRFRDGWSPQAKPPHYFTGGETDEDLSQRRQRYDDFLAYADAEFGRLYAFMQRAGILDDTLVVFTSDHGEMFERGIKGHNTPVLYNPLVRIPLIVHRPGQQGRVDIAEATSCTDIVPTLAQAAGLPAPGWCEGRPLPTRPEAGASAGRSIFSIDARRNPKYQPLTIGTVSMVKSPYKLMHFFGYEGYESEYELYDLENDPEEMADLYAARPAIAAEMRDELLASLEGHNRDLMDSVQDEG